MVVEGKEERGGKSWVLEGRVRGLMMMMMMRINDAYPEPLTRQTDRRYRLGDVYAHETRDSTRRLGSQAQVTDARRNRADARYRQRQKTNGYATDTTHTRATTAKTPQQKKTEPESKTLPTTGIPYFLEQTIQSPKRRKKR